MTDSQRILAYLRAHQDDMVALMATLRRCSGHLRWTAWV